VAEWKSKRSSETSVGQLMIMINASSLADEKSFRNKNFRGIFGRGLRNSKGNCDTRGIWLGCGKGLSNLSRACF
jgi:hypothetical protein